MMKKILSIIFLLISYNVIAQNPSQAVPTQYSTGWFRQGWHQSDSGEIIAPRVPNFTPRFPGTTILYQQNGVDTSLHYWTGLRWIKINANGNRFGIEDNTSTVNRLMDMQGHTMEIDSFTFFSLFSKKHTVAPDIGLFSRAQLGRNYIDFFIDNANGDTRSFGFQANGTLTQMFSVGYNQTARGFVQADTMQVILESDPSRLYIFHDSIVAQNIDGGLLNFKIRNLAYNASSSLRMMVIDSLTGQVYRQVIPTGGGGSGTVTSAALSMPSAFTVTGSPITTSGTFAVSGAGTTLQYIRGNGTLATTDTSMIPDFYLKVRGLLSGTSPVTFNTVSGAIGITNANTSGTKGAATFNSSFFSDNGAGLISFNTVVPAGSCINCNLNVDDYGRITSYASGTPPVFANALGAGDTLARGDTIKRLNPGWGILHTVDANKITQDVDSSEVATQYDLSLVNNGLSRSDDTTQLGGALVKVTTLSVGSTSNYLSLTSTGTSTPLRISTTGASNGIFVNSFAGTGIAVNAQSNNANAIQGFAFGTGYGASLSSASNLGAYIATTSGISGAAIEINPSSTNTQATILQLKRYTSGTATNDIAGAIEFITEPASGTVDVTTGYIVSRLTDATFATRTSAMDFHTTNSTVTARKASIAGSGQWTWDGYPTLTAQTDTTTYKPVAIDGSGNVVKMAGWSGSGAGASDLDAVLALGGRLSADRNVSMAQRRWNLDSAAFRLRTVDSAGISIDLAKAGTMLQFNKPEGTARTYPGSTPFKFIMENSTDDEPTERNNPVKWGWNINRADSTNAAGVWYSMEPNYRPGGARWLEMILEVSLPNGTLKNSRLFMSTFKRGAGDSIESAENQWDFRGTGWAFMNLKSTIGYVTMGAGTLNVNNTSPGNTDFSISNGADVSHFNISPGTSILDYNGPMFRISGNLNAAVHSLSSTERPGIRFIGDGGNTGYVLKYNSAWGVSYLQNAMGVLAANGTPTETSLILKPGGTAWLGNIDLYNTGSQKVNISGTMAIRGIPTVTTVTNILGRNTDSSVVSISAADLATQLGAGGPTLYTGDGTLAADRNVSSGGFTLRIAGANNSDTLVSITNTGTSSTGLYSIGSLFGVDAQSTNVGLRAFGTSTGMLATGDSDEGAVIKSNTIRGATIQSVPTSTNTVQEVLRVERGVNGSPGANGVGGSIDFYNKNSDNTSNPSNQLISEWTNATVGTRTSKFSLTGVNSAVTATLLEIGGNGGTTFNKYGVGTFTGTPAYYLQVTSAGAIIEQSATLVPTISTGTSAPGTTPAKVGDMFIDTTGKKLYFATGTSSSADWTIAN